MPDTPVADESTLGSVSSEVGRVLADMGVRQVFGVVGSGNYAVTAALVEGGARFVGARHEGAAVTMADSYGRVSGQVAACTVHQGPGLTNTITGLVDAVKSRTPLVVLAGQTSAGALRSNFSLDQSRLVDSVGAIAEQVYRPDTAVADVARAFRRTVLERRPVVVNLPLDVQAARADARRRGGMPQRAVPATPDENDVAAIADLLMAARRPLLVAGRGAHASRAGADLRRLAERCGALLATTALANGLFAGDAWSVGIVGGFATDATASIVADADVVIGFGTSFTDWTTRSGRLFGLDATVVQVDDDPLALGQSARVDRGVVGDARATVGLLIAELDVRAHDAAGWRSPDLAARIATAVAPTDRGPVTTASGKVHPRRLSQAVEALLPVERTVVVDGGHFIGWPITTWTVPDPQGFVFSSAGFQSIGLGLAAAIGAHLARPDRLTVLAAGDGGFLMSISELETLVRLNLPVLVVIYNDAAYGAEVHHFAPAADGVQLVRFPDTDFAALARGAGAQALRVRRLRDLVPLRAWLAAPQGPMIVDAKIDETIVGHWAQQDFVGH